MRVAELVHALDQGDNRPEPENHHGDDKGPEIELQSVAKWVLRVGRPFRTA